ncbi:endonuclease/exonuclease/phosphatase family protein [Paracoccus pacificus]|uniref:Endonuclease/exonuclease/phosphatase family protein n=1 Tax=Paracoccus pacificus TaxID=1463598 RepID=A0ABW4R8A6_9RHOB
MQIRIASYNLHKCRGMTGPHDPGRNLAVIRELDADIVALQEVDFRFGARPEALPRRLVREATGLAPAEFVGTGKESLGWHGQTILARPALLDDGSIRRLPLPGLEPRGALALTLPGITVVGVHLGLLRSSRRAQLDRLIRHLTRREGECAILGDFNEWRDDLGLEPLAGMHLLTPGRTWPALAPRLRLDRFALSTGVRIVNSGAHDTPLARAASDHLPIWADIEIG